MHYHISRFNRIIESIEKEKKVLYGLCEVRQNMTAYTDQEGEKSVLQWEG